MKFFTWQELITLWKLKDFQLFNLLKKGLQPYTQYGKKIIDSDSLERAPRDSLETIKRNLRAKSHAQVLGSPGTASSGSPFTGEERAQMIFKSQRLEIVNPPKDCVLISFTLPLNEIKARKKLMQALGWLFEGNNVLEVARKHGLPLPDSEIVEQREVARQGGLPLPHETSKQKATAPYCKPGTKWEDITMTLVADDMLEIKTPQGGGRFTYHQLEMRDIRKGDKPTMLWGLIKLFAKMDGFISSQNPEYDPTLPDTAKRLSKHLKQLFGIDESIYTGHYKKEKGYRTRIKFYDRTF